MSTDTLHELEQAIASSDLGACRRILELQPDLAKAAIAAPPTESTRATRTLLHLAMPGDGVSMPDDQLGIVAALLDCGLGVDELGHGQNHGRCTALNLAAWGGHASLVRLLLDRGADPNGAMETERSKRPISTAARHGHRQSVELLVRAGAEHDVFDLAYVGMTDHIREMFAAEPKLAQMRDADGQSPLHTAVTTKAGRHAVAELLSLGFDRESLDRRGRTAALVAAEHGHRDTARQLAVQSPSLFFTAAMGDTRTSLAILEATPAEATKRQPDGVTALFHAALSGSVELSERLLELGAHPAPQSDRFWAARTPLHLAIQGRHRKVVSLLLENGANPNVGGDDQGDYWPTPLHAAIRWSDVDMARLLFRRGAQPYGPTPPPDGYDCGPLEWAVMSNNVTFLELAIEEGMDLAHVRVRAAQARAAELGRHEIAELLTLR